MKTSEKFGELIKALTKAQGQFTKAVYDKTNPHFKSKYASLDAVHEAIKGPMAANGLAVSHLLSYKDGMILMETTLFHTSAEWIACEMPILVEKSTPQQLGSLLSYYRRYSLCCLLAIPVGEEDDDGEQAEGRNQMGWIKPIVKESLPVAKPGPCFTQEQAEELEENLKYFPDLRNRMLKFYDKQSFLEIEAKHHKTILTAIEKEQKKAKEEEIPL
jgi:ERF superfamily protein